MRCVSLFGTVFLVYLFFSQSYAEKQETEKALPVTKRQLLYERKCSKCHPRGRVFADPKIPDEWRSCVARMREKSPLWITSEEGEQIVGEILHTREDVVGSFPHKKKYDDAKLLFIDRCTECHSPDRIVLARKTRNNWKQTVLKMQKKSPASFLDEDIPILTDYLAERGELIRDDHAAELMVTKCLVCHDAARILLERKSGIEWEKSVTDMQVYARKHFLGTGFCLANSLSFLIYLRRRRGLNRVDRNVLEIFIME